MEQEFPGNSHAARLAAPKVSTQPSPPKEPEKPEIKGNVVVRKKSLMERFKNLYVEESESFADHIVKNVIIPTVQQTCITIVKQIGDGIAMSVEQKLTGKVTPRSGMGSGTGAFGTTGRVNYTRYSSPSQLGAQVRAGAPQYQPIRKSNILQEIVFDNREEPEMILDYLQGLIVRKHHATVSDYYGLVSVVTPVVTDEHWGWTDLNSTMVVTVDGGYFINFPRPTPISR